MPTGDAHFSCHLIPSHLELAYILPVGLILFSNVSGFFWTMRFELPSVLSRFYFNFPVEVMQKINNIPQRKLPPSPSPLEPMIVSQYRSLWFNHLDYRKSGYFCVDLFLRIWTKSLSIYFCASYFCEFIQMLKIDLCRHIVNSLNSILLACNEHKNQPF